MPAKADMEGGAVVIVQLPNGQVFEMTALSISVDINPSTIIKLNDRGSFQTIGVVTDVEPFLRVVVHEVEALEAG